MIRRIERAGGVRFQLYARRDGKKVYLGTFDSEREAKEALEEHRVTQRKIERGELPPQTDMRRTFGAAVRLWLAGLERSGSRSHDEYKSRVELYLLPRFGDVALVDIGKSDVVRWRDDLLERVSGATVNTCMGTLSSACSWFVDHDYIPTNPCNRIKPAKHIAKVFPWLQTSEAITRLLSTCTDNIRTLLAVLVGTGLRLDEALHLRWDDIDLDHWIIIVHRGRRGAPKSGRLRHVPIFDSVLPGATRHEARARRERNAVARSESGQAPRSGERAEAVQGCGDARQPSGNTPSARSAAHVCIALPRGRWRPVQAGADPRALLRQDHGADLRTPDAHGVRGGLQPGQVPNAERRASLHAARDLSARGRRAGDGA